MDEKRKEIIDSALNDSRSYEEYNLLVEELVEAGKSSGPNQEDLYVDFTKLNNHRAKRLDKTSAIDESFNDTLIKIDKKQTWIVVTESWCGDAVQALPYFHKFSLANSNINLRVVLRDEHTELIDLFLTNGGRSIPKLIIIEENTVVGDWGPRPGPAQEMYMDFRNEPNGRVYEDVQVELQKWYIKDKGITMQNEIKSILEKYYG